MNEYLQRLRQLEAQRALTDTEVAEVAVCAKAAGVRVQLEHMDLRTGDKRRWAIEADGTRNDSLSDALPKTPKKRRSRNGVQVVGGFQMDGFAWEIPDEIEAGPQP